MASIVKTPSGYRAQIMLKGIRKSKSFKAKYKAINWARNEEELIRLKLLDGEKKELLYGPEVIFLGHTKAQGRESAAPIASQSITIDSFELEALLARAAEAGAKRVMMTLVTYNISEAAKRLGLSSRTVSKRIHEAKIKTINGRITGAELMRYLREFDG